MSLKTVEIVETYDSSIQDIVNEFYVPVLQESVNYNRIAGFFTSSSLLISFRGFEGIVKNGGKIRLIVSPRLSNEDISVIDNYKYDIEKYLEKSFDEELMQLNNDDVNTRELLAWLLANNYLEIKVAVILKSGRPCSENEINNSALFHQKVGILTDRYGNKLSFSGSINETINAWIENNEEFKTFKSWEESQVKYLNDDINKFDQYWSGEKGNTRVYPFPTALRDKLIKELPKSLNYSYKDITKIIKEKYYSKKDDKISLFFYQQEALDKWISCDRKMLFEMATGTGKTRTAIACVQNNLHNFKRNLIVISTPEETLSKQWVTEIEKLNVNFEKVIFASGTTPWRKEVEEAVLKLNIGALKNTLIVTTHDTVSSNDFIAYINLIKRNKVNTLFVGDEVHALGSGVRRKALIDMYQNRIGLSATPSRWFDEDGTKVLQDYFNNSSYEFGIDKALTTLNPLTSKTFLCPYEYYIKQVDLSDDELQEYVSLSNRISKDYFLHKNKDGKKDDHILEEKRANIIKSARNKITALRNLLFEIGLLNLKNTIIFTSPDLIDDVCDLLSELGIIHHKFTKDQGKKVKKEFGNISERQFIIEQFKQENIKVLVAIKCLDEGIDIPTADRAILLSSTTNPREYIQRIGRVIRQADNKKQAYIYDFVVSVDDMYGELDSIVSKIERNERKRSLYIIKNARNSAKALIELEKCLKGGLDDYGY